MTEGNIDVPHQATAAAPARRARRVSPRIARYGRVATVAVVAVLLVLFLTAASHGQAVRPVGDSDHPRGETSIATMMAST